MSDFTNTPGVLPSIEKDTTATTGSNLENTKSAVANSEYTSSKSGEQRTDEAIVDASAAANTVKNHPITQNIVNGPVAESVKDQTAKTQSEFSNLAASRTTPATPAATGQQLTHYHSFFSSLLSWNNPRASGIAYASVVLFIFAVRYLDLLRYAFKATYVTLFFTVLAEATGKALFGEGFVTKIRPRKYYTIPKQTLDSLTGDFHELLNFFVIESQRIVFAENVAASAAAFLGAFISYFLIKIVPLWGLTLLTTSTIFLGPLVYKTNKEVIDAQLAHASSIINQQTKQARDLASQHASRAAETTKQYAHDYTVKAQELVGNARGRSTSPSLTKKETSPAYKSEDFPAAPKEEFKASAVPAVKTEEPLIAT